MKVKVIKEGVTLESGILDIGTEIDVTDKAGQRLIADGYVEAVATAAPKKGQTPAK